MATDTHVALNYNDVYLGGSPKKVEWAVLAEAVGPGDTMRLASDGKIYACKNSDGPAAGIMALAPGHAISADYTVGDLCPYHPRGCGNKVVVWRQLLSAAVAMVVGNPIVVSSTDDQVQIFAYSDAAIATDTLNLRIGSCAKYHAGDASYAKLIEMILD